MRLMLSLSTFSWTRSPSLDRPRSSPDNTAKGIHTNAFAVDAIGIRDASRDDIMIEQTCTLIQAKGELGELLLDLEHTRRANFNNLTIVAQRMVAPLPFAATKDRLVSI